MLDIIKNLFEKKPAVNFNELVNRGAVILDVRSDAEFRGGHIKGSINIALPSLTNNLHKLSKQTPIITCCASGMRSASAKNVLQANGFTEVHNGGGWMSLQSKLNSTSE